MTTTMPQSLLFAARDELLIRRVRAEFIEAPGLSPTIAEAVKLFQLPRDQCSSVLSHLVRDGFLRETRRGRFCAI